MNTKYALITAGTVVAITSLQQNILQKEIDKIAPDVKSRNNLIWGNSPKAANFQLALALAFSAITIYYGFYDKS